MQKQDFNYGWTFEKEGGHTVQSVTLPHDAMIYEERKADSPGGAAAAWFTGGRYVYRKTFEAPEEWNGKHVEILFEGIYKNAIVYINGKKAAENAYGYTTFSVILDDYMCFGKENEIRIDVDNHDMPNCRWYSGAGIYRPVWLYVSEANFIPINGIKISTISYETACIRIETEHTGGEVEVEIFDQGQLIASGQGDAVEITIPDAKLWSDETPYLYTCRTVLKTEGMTVDESWETFGIRKVEWSPKGLFINGKNTLLRGACIHSDNGILGACSYAKSEERRIRILKAYGFNAIRASHNPAAAATLEACDKYGMYVMDETWDVWYSHKSKYDYAADFEKNYKSDLKAMADRDYNHPSVIMYSIGNEVSEPHTEKGIQLTKEMTDYLHALDTSRPVTAGINLMIIDQAKQGKAIYNEEGGRNEEGDSLLEGNLLQEGNSPQQENKAMPQEMNSKVFNMIATQVGANMIHSADSDQADEATSPCLDILDIAGYNYASGRYPMEGEKHPDRIIVGTETFVYQLADNWEMVQKYPYLIGDFMWTGWDYLGEAGIGAWSYKENEIGFEKPYPWILAEGGAIDILGNAGAEAANTAIIWGARKEPYIGVQPVNHPGIEPAKAAWRGSNAFASWSWSGCEGNEAVVEVYADADTAELFLNGVSLGKQKLEKFKTEFKVPYMPGVLSAVVYNQFDEKAGETELISAKEETGIVIKPEETSVKAEEIVYVDILTADINGIVESNADCEILLSVDGGELLAFGSANPRTEESFNTGRYTTYYGRAQAVIKAGLPGKLVIKAASAELGEVAAALDILE